MKKFLAILLTVIMLATNAPLGAFAASPETSGVTGDCTWKLDGTVLTISGNGEMANYYYQEAPWDANIESVIIESGVTSIGNYAFYQCGNLAEISMPDTLLTIGKNAFSFCDNLTTLNLPNSINKIDSFAFHFCKKLTRVTFPSGMVEFGNDIFEYSDLAYGYCSENSSAAEYLEANNYDIVYSDGSDLESIVEGQVGNFEWKIDKRTGVLELCGIGKMIDFSSANPPWYDFRKYIILIKLQETITYIGENAFKNCYSLEGIASLKNIEFIGEKAFQGCEKLDTVSLGNKLIKIDNFAFYECYALKELVIPDSVESIGGYAFHDCRNIEKLVLGNNVKDIATSAFSGCSNLKKIMLPYSINKIAFDVFADCINLTEIIVFNKKCAFDSDCGLNYKQTIYGYIGSTAEAFAEKIGAKFIDVETIYTHSHDYKNATCTEPQICKICGNTYGDELGHSYSNNCDSDCNICGETRTIKHNYINREYDDIYHWSLCDCGASTDKVLHDFNVYDYNDTMHQAWCYCGAKHKPSPHIYINDTDEICEICGAVREITCETIGHKYDNACDSGCNFCGETRGVLDHTYKKYKTTDATTSKNGKKYYKCEDCGATKTSTIYKASKIKLSTEEYTYNGKTKKPSVKIYTSKGKKLTEGDDYKLSRPKSSKKVGKYKIKITFKGDYTGTKSIYYTINPKGTKVSSVSAAKKSLKVKISKQSTQTTGYQIQYSTSSKFKSAKTKTISSYKTTSYTIKSLKAKKTYYVRVRTYKTVDGKKYYSDWSKAVKKKTK